MPPALSHKAKLSFALLAAVVLLVAGIVLGLVNEQARRGERLRELGVQADILSASVTAALAFDDRTAAQEYVDALQVNPQLRAAGVYQTQGPLFAGFGPAVPPSRPAAAAAFQPMGLVVIREVAQGGDTLGEVFIGAQPEPVSAVLRRQGGSALLVLMATLFLGLLGGAYAALDRRAEELARANEALHRAAEERDRAEEALLQAKKMEALGQLTGGIAHDFNNLLQAITGSFDLIQRRPEDEARVRRMAEVGGQAAERGRKLTSQLLAFSRAPQVQLRTVMVGAVIEGMSTLLGSTVGPLIRVDLDLDDGEVPVTADPVQLEMAILNLAVNARDAMPEGGVLAISLASRRIAGEPELPDDTYLEVRVADTGPGMDAEIRDRAFEPFFTTKGVGAGTGLGLAQVYAMARQAGGLARIESEPGQGTAVILLLRRADQPGVFAEGLGPELAALTVPSRSARILVVDDDFEVRSLLKESLQSLGHSVTDCADAASAVRLIERERPDLMLVDFAMPVMNGAELAIEARRRWPDLPIVFASGYAEVDQVEAALGPGAPILRKPFSIHELSDAIDQALRADATR
jgi:signal transduction histidine kinase/ActR/RegA family two-component response regulator